MLAALFLGAAIIVAVASIRILVRFGFRTFAKVILGFAAVLAIFYGLVRLGGCTDDDHPALVDEVVAGHHRLRHPSFDFAFAHPGDAFVANPELAEKMEPISGATCDAFVGKRGDALFAVCAVDSEVTSREAFYAAVADVRRGLSRALAPRPGEAAAISFGAFAASLDAPANTRGTQALEALAAATPLRVADDVGYANGHGTAYVHIVERGLHVRIKLFTVERGLAMMIAVSQSDGALEDVVASFAPA
jgi:hypothetical protein